MRVDCIDFLSRDYERDEWLLIDYIGDIRGL